MNTALKKINARVKVLAKKHPGKKRKTLQKQAGKEWKAGKLKGAVGAVKKRKPAKRRVVKRVRRVVKRVTPVKHKRRTVRKKTVAVHRKRHHYKVTHRVRRISGKKSSIMPIIALAAVGIGAYLLLRPQPAAQLVQTSNPVRNTNANNILTYAAAAGLTATAIAQLITALNNSNDAQVNNAAANPGSYLADLQNNGFLGD